MRYSSIFTALAISAGISLVTVVHAQQGSSSTASGQSSDRLASSTQSGASVEAPQLRGTSAPMGGRPFGEHVSGMAPEHPRMHGSHFGECVSNMAIMGECPHHDLH